MVTCKVETITQALADEYLTQTNGLNRTLSNPHVAELIGKQMRGEWVMNGDTIRFDSKGQLRDGQHRLRMVQLTGIPIEVIVVRGLDPAAFITMDVGKKRSLQDVYTIAHEPRPKLLAPASALIWRYLTGNLKGNIGSHDEIKAILADHPEIRNSCAFYDKIPKKQVPAPPHWNATIAAHYLFSRIDTEGAKEKADTFISNYTTGLNATEGDPAFLARNCLMNIERGNRPATDLQAFRLLAQAFNLYQADKKVIHNFKVLKRSKIVEHFTIDGFPKKLFINRPSQMALFDELEEKHQAEQDTNEEG
jgi:hypothetical protein